jgi:hypothetical protein
MYDSVLLYRGAWQGERWRAELIDELPVEGERGSDDRRPAASRLFRLADPPILTFEVRGGEGVVHEHPASNGAPLLLSPMEPSKRVEEREGTSLWLAPNLQWWTRRAQPGVEAYRVLVHEALGHSFLFEAERRGPGGVLEGRFDCGVQRRWQLSAEEWQGLRERGMKILDAEPHGGHCGMDGYSTVVEALVEGRWRVVERDCEDLGGLLSFLRSRERELVRECPPRR